jgi:hypothetical protein
MRKKILKSESQQKNWDFDVVGQDGIERFEPGAEK